MSNVEGKCFLGTFKKFKMVGSLSEGYGVEEGWGISLYLFREEATSALADFHVGPLAWSSWRCWLENPEKNPRSKARTSNKLNPHMAPGGNRACTTLMGGERSELPPLRSTCFPKGKTGLNHNFWPWKFSEWCCVQPYHKWIKERLGLK